MLSQISCFLSCRLFLWRSFCRCRLRLVGTIGLGFDDLGLLRCEHLVGLSEQVRLAFVRNNDVVREDKAQGEAGYTQAVNSNKRAAQSKVVQMIVPGVGTNVGTQQKQARTGTEAS